MIDYAGLLRYDPASGEFRWLISRGRVRKGRIAGSPNSHGYVKIGVTVEGETQSWTAHRLAWFLMTGRFPVEIDHINGVKTDNRWANLREASRSENCLNPANKLSCNNKTGHRGIFKRKYGWLSQLRVNGQLVLMAHFPTEEKAIAARLQAEQQFLPAKLLNPAGG